MSKSFKLIKQVYSEQFQEWQWTYQYLSTLSFKGQTIHWITITDYYQIKHKKITKELILNIFQAKINGLKKVKPVPNSYLKWGKDIFYLEVGYQEKRYRLIFWFKRDTIDHLWVRNCYPIKC